MKTLIKTGILLLLVNVKFAKAQSVTISPNNGSSIIESKGNNKAIKLPTVSATSAITSPQKGMVVFDDATGTLSYFNGSIWIPLSNSTTGWAVNGTSLNSTNSGNVGIGISNPLSKLHVSLGASGIAPHANSKVLIEDNSNTYLNINTPDANEGGILFGRPTFGATSGGIIYSSVRSLQFRTSSNDTRMVITEPGLVGIGTSTPFSKLHLHEQSSFDNFIKITNNVTTDNQGLWIGVDGSGKSSIYELSSKGIGINVGGVSLDLKPSNTGGNAVEISDKGIFSDLLTNVNMVPLAIGELNFTVTKNKIAGNQYIITNINNSYNGPIINSINLECYDVTTHNIAKVTLNLNNAIQNNYSKLYFVKSVEDNVVEDLHVWDTSINLGPTPKITMQIDFNFGRAFYILYDGNFNIPFILYGVK